MNQYTVRWMKLSGVSFECWCVINPRGTIMCMTRECDGRTAEENAYFIANMMNREYNYAPVIPEETDRKKYE